MTKKEILKIIEARQAIINNEALLDITKSSIFTLEEDEWFRYIQDIEELKDDFKILKKEVKEAIEVVNKSKIELDKFDKEKCDHSLRLHYSALFYNYSECIFCGKKINGDNCPNGNTIYNDINRNKKCVTFNGGYFDDDGNIKAEYTLNYVFKIVKEILKDKLDDEEINFIEEFKKLNIDTCKIDEREYEEQIYVLVIGGSNKQYLNDNQFITSKNNLDSLYITNFLCNIPGVQVELFENRETYNSQKFYEYFPNKKTDNSRFDTYETLDNLIDKIKEENNVPFNLIINMSSLFTYENNNISKYNLDLNTLFPNSYIINISKCNISTQKELLELLKNMLLIYNNAYIANNNKYYQLLNNNVQEITINETCKDIKKLLLEKS